MTITEYKGDLLVELDREPYETAVAVKKAAVDIAKANWQVAEASVRSIEAKARSQYWALQIRDGGCPKQDRAPSCEGCRTG